MRRKDYSIGRGTPDARLEVWVVYDRLWRSGNRLGSSTEAGKDGSRSQHGQLWEDAEYGYNGEPLGCEPRSGKGEGKLLPAHLRQSHRKFIEDIRCHDCDTQIHERCEHCSIRMHCMGCRKTLCANCAFARPLPKISRDDESLEEFWWAPGQVRKPELMLQELSTTSISDHNNFPNSTITPPVNTQWCCLKPMFSNGGSITFIGPGMTAPATNHIRTSPLPKGAGYGDPEFTRLKSVIDRTISPDDRIDPFIEECEPKSAGKQILDKIFDGPGISDGNTCPRSLCQDCWETPGWRAACRFCKEPFCIAHDLRGLNVRICGYNDLSVEKALLEEKAKIIAILKDWKETVGIQIGTPHGCSSKTNDSALDELHALIATMPSGTWQRQVGREIRAFVVDVNTREGLDGTSHDCGPLRSMECRKFSTGLEACENDTLENLLSRLKPKLSWRGCGCLICPQFRPIGDHRPKCTAVAKQCTICSIHVCPDCLVENPACNCSYCKDHYACPECFCEVGSECKKAEEEVQRKKKRVALKRKILLGAKKLREADEAVERAGQFLGMLFGDTEMKEEEPGQSEVPQEETLGNVLAHIFIGDAGDMIDLMGGEVNGRLLTISEDQV